MNLVIAGRRRQHCCSWQHYRHPVLAGGAVFYVALYICARALAHGVEGWVVRRAMLPCVSARTRRWELGRVGAIRPCAHACTRVWGLGRTSRYPSVRERPHSALGVVSRTSASLRSQMVTRRAWTLASGRCRLCTVARSRRREEAGEAEEHRSCHRRDARDRERGASTQWCGIGW